MRTRLALAFAALVASAGLAMTAAGPATFSGEAYPLDTCPVSGEKLGKDAKVVVLEGMKDKTLDGTQVKFCCGKCAASFKSEPEKYLPKMNDAIVKASPAYPLKACLVMQDDALDADAKTIVWQNRVYKFCCGKCINKFKSDPAKFAADYEKQVVAAQKASYKGTTCPISGKPLGDGAVDVVVNCTLVRTCCPGCVDGVKADPKAAIAKVSGAAVAAPAGAPAADGKK